MQIQLHLLHFSTAAWTTGVTTGKVYIVTLHDSGTSLDVTYALSQVWQICLAESHILACEKAPSEVGKKFGEWASGSIKERRDSASEASGTRGSL